MQFPLPFDNLEPDDFGCVKVYYPNDPKYRRALFGALTAFENWFVWERDDNQSGKRAAAIWRVANGLTDSHLSEGCDCEPVPPLPPEIIRETIYLGGAGGDEGEDEFMAGCGPIPIRVENGKLQFYWCCEWVDLMDATLTPSEPVNPHEGDDPQPTYSACGKATALMDMAYAIMQAFIDCLALNPVQWRGHIQAAMPGYGMNYTEAFNGVMQTGICVIAFGEDVILDPDTKQKVICHISEFFTADGKGFSLDIFKGIKAAVKSVWSAEGILYGQIGGAFEYALDTLGFADSSQVAVLGATDTESLCDCPEAPAVIPPDLWTGYTWKHVMDFTTRTTQPSHYGIRNSEGAWHLSSAGYPLTGFWSADSSQYRRVKVGCNVEATGGTLTGVAFKIKAVPGGSWYADTTINAHGIVVGAHVTNPDLTCIGTPIWWSVNTSQLIDNDIFIDLPGFLAAHYDDHLFSCGVVAVAICGTGTDPYTTDPDA